MQEFETSEESIAWLEAKEKRVLVLRAKHHEGCENHFLNDFVPYSETKTSYEFACIDEAIFAPQITDLDLTNRYIIGMGAPLSQAYLDSLLSD